MAFWVDKGIHSKSQSWTMGQEPMTCRFPPGSQPFPRGAWPPSERVLGRCAGEPIYHKPLLLHPPPLSPCLHSFHSVPSSMVTYALPYGVHLSAQIFSMPPTRLTSISKPICLPLGALRRNRQSLSHPDRHRLGRLCCSSLLQG